MTAIKILPDIYSVGVVDWNIRNFHGHTYTTKRGSSYNAYLIVDEKVVLIDTVLASFTSEFINNIKEIVPIEKIDYIIANHVEADHSGALPEIMKLCPKAKIFGTQKCKEGLEKHYYGNWNFQVVKSGDILKLGRRTLNFIEAAMIHWPDSMFTYCPEEALLMPNDAFGQHFAASERFDDEVDQCALMDETQKYYANILWPLGSVILKKIQELQKSNIAIKMIAPSHGIIWRKNPGKAINAYLDWTTNKTENKVVIVYETMWGATEKMAEKIASGITESGVSVKIYNIAETDRTEAINEMLTSKGFIFGSSTHDNDMLPNIAAFLEIVKGFKPKDRKAAFFGSHGWAGGAVKEMEELLKSAGLNPLISSLSVKYTPSPDELQACFEFGRSFANILKA